MELPSMGVPLHPWGRLGTPSTAGSKPRGSKKPQWPPLEAPAVGVRQETMSEEGAGARTLGFCPCAGRERGQLDPDAGFFSCPAQDATELWASLLVISINLPLARPS